MDNLNPRVYVPPHQMREIELNLNTYVPLHQCRSFLFHSLAPRTSYALLVPLLLFFSQLFNDLKFCETLSWFILKQESEIFFFL